MNLTDFLLARIAEDEAVAHPLANADTRSGLREGSREYVEATPTRVLAECEAKRQIVKLWAEEWDEWHGPGSGLTRTRMTDDQFLRVLTAERVLGALALPYADHEDFREEWKDRAHE